jgi:hypothetical protein
MPSAVAHIIESLCKRTALFSFSTRAVQGHPSNLDRRFGIRLLRIFSLSRICVCKRFTHNLISCTYFDIVSFQVLMAVTKEFGLLRCYATYPENVGSNFSK